jgi:formamidopyrimidine-DNA glycosylase
MHRLGKQIILEIDTSDPRRWLCIHLRMTGRLIYDPGLPEGRHETAEAIRARLRLDRGVLVFQDVRRFGTMRLATPDDVCAGGIDPTTSSFTARCLGRLIAGGRTPIKPWLLRQDKVAGLGNIYVCESLFQARLSPLRPAFSIDAVETARLRKAIRRVLDQAIKAGGTTFSDYRDGQGGRGRFQNRLAVYGREGEPCRVCGTPIERIGQGGRSTFYCPQCQAE